MRQRLVFRAIAVAAMAAWLRAAPLPDRGRQPEIHEPGQPPAAIPLDSKVSYGITQKRLENVVSALGEQVGLRYNWKKSYRRTHPLCRRFLHNVVIEDEPFRQAMAQVLQPMGLRYQVEKGAIVLYRERRRK
jgi:hypothetical protein